MSPVHSHPRSDAARAKAEALALWESDRARLLVAQPFLALLAMQLELVPVVDDRLETACTDGERIFVDARFLLGLGEDERVFVLAHEVWHCALGHLARRQGRRPGPWNRAVDHEVNALLEAEGMAVPADAVLYRRLRGRNAEAVYAELLSQGAGAEAPRGRLADRHELPAAGAGAVIDPDLTPASPRAVRAAAADWPTRILAAAQQVARRGGGLSPAVARLVTARRRPPLPWPQLLRRFLQASRSAERSWRRPNRRFVGQGLYLPGRGDGRLDMALAIDTSGSTSLHLGAFAAELNAIVGGFGDYRLRVLMCDTEVREALECTPDAPLRVERLRFSGGGGTDFRPVFGHLARGEPPQGLIFFTDGFGAAPEHPPAWPVLWALLPHGTCPAPWGGRVTLGGSEDAASDGWDPATAEAAGAYAL